MKNKKLKLISVLSTLFIGLIYFGILFVSAGGVLISKEISLGTDGLISAPLDYKTTNLFQSFGYSGMNIDSVTINGVSINSMSYSDILLNMNNKFTKINKGVEQYVHLENKLFLSTDVDFSIISKIDYNEIRWNGNRYKLNETPLKLTTIINNNGKVVAPNIFFDDTFNKRINYQDIADKGGYALVYQKNGENIIELRIDKFTLSPFSTSIIDPSYVNQTDGFSTASAGAGSVAGIAMNNSDFWVSDNNDIAIYHFNKSGANLTGSMSYLNTPKIFSVIGVITNNSDFWFVDYYFTSKKIFVVNSSHDVPYRNFSTVLGIGANNPRGITTNITQGNVTDIWMTDFSSKFIYHIDGYGNNLSGGFSTTTCSNGNPQGITTNNSDFWVIDQTNSFVCHFDKNGVNQSDGFSLIPFGSSSPEGITTNVTSGGSPKDFWFDDSTDSFVYHLLLTYLPATINITFPINNTNSSNIQLDVNSTILINDFPLDSVWYSNDTYLINSSLGSGGVYFNITNITWSEGKHNVTMWINDTSGAVNSSSISFIIDTINPNINITSPINNSNSSDNTLDINYTRSDSGTGVSSCWYSNDTYSVNTTLPFCGNITSIIWSDALHNLTIWLEDYAGNINSSKISFLIDTSGPVVNIIYPLNLTYNFNMSINLNYSSLDSGIGIITGCNYSIINSTGGNSIVPSTNLPIISNVCQNTTFNLSSVTTNYNLTVCSNDSLNNWGCSKVQFGINMINPQVSLNSPLDNSYLNNGTHIYFNFTATKDIGLDTCQLWGNWSGGWHLNYSWIKPTNATMNYTILNLSEGSYFWNVECNDTSNNIGWSSNNFTLNIDLTNPGLLINSITTTTGSLIVQFNSSETDNFGVSSCNYTILNSLGSADGASNNTLYTCGGNLSHSLVVSAYGTYTLRLGDSDLAGNSNTTTKIFVVSPIVTTPPSGGGGGGPTTEEVIISNRTFCGDNICQKPNFYNITEDFYNCPVDCQSSFNLDDFFNSLAPYCFDNNDKTSCIWSSLFENFFSAVPLGAYGSNIVHFNGQVNGDTLLLNCFAKDKNNIDKQCFWETDFGTYAIIGITILIILSFLIKVENRSDGGKKQNIYRYIAFNVNSKRKKRRGY